MAQFDQRVAEIQQAVIGLVDTLRQADSAVGQLDTRFTTLIQQARTVSQLVSAVKELDTAIGSISSESVQGLQQKLQSVLRAIEGVNVGKITSLNDALDRQRAVIEDLSEAQARISRAVQDSKREFGELKSELSGLAGEIATLDTSVASVASSIRAMADAATSTADLQKVINALANQSNRIKPEVWSATADGISRIATAVNRLDTTKLDALRSLAQSGGTINVNIGDTARVRATETQRSAAPTPRQTVETPKVVVTDTAGVKSETVTRSEPATRAPAPSRAAVYGSNVNMDFIPAVRELIRREDAVMTDLRKLIAMNTGTDIAKVDLEKIYSAVFKALDKPNDTRALGRAQDLTGDLGYGIVAKHAQEILNKITSIPDPSGRAGGAGYVQRGIQAAQEVYRAPAGPDPYAGIPDVIKIRREMAEFQIQTMSSRFGSVADGTAPEAEQLASMIDAVAKGIRAEDLPAEIRKFADSIRQASRFVDSRLKDRPGYSTEDVRAHVEASRATANTLLAAPAMDTSSLGTVGNTLLDKAKGLLAPIVREFNGIVAGISSASDGALRDGSTYIKGQIDQLYDRFSIVVSSFDVIPEQLTEIIDYMRRSLDILSRKLSTIAKYASLTDTNDVNMEGLRAFARTALGDIVGKNMLGIGREADEPRAGRIAEGNYARNEIAQSETGVLYRVADETSSKDERLAGNLELIKRAMAESGSDLVYLAGAHDEGHLGSVQQDMGDVQMRLDHAMLAFFDRVEDKIRILDIVPGAKGIDLGEGIGDGNAMLASKSGVNVDSDNILGNYQTMTAVPITVDPAVAARIAAETAVVQKPGEGYALIAEFGETCSSSIHEGFKRAGLDQVSSVAKTALGYNVVTPGDMLNFVQGLNQAGAVSTQPADLQSDLQRFTQIQAQLFDELGRFIQNDVVDRAGVAGVDANDVYSVFKGASTGDDYRDQSAAGLVGGMTEEGYSVSAVISSYDRTLTAVTEYISRINAALTGEDFSNIFREQLNIARDAMASFSTLSPEQNDIFRGMARYDVKNGTDFQNFSVMFTQLLDAIGAPTENVKDASSAVGMAITTRDAQALTRAVDQLRMAIMESAIANMEKHVSNMQQDDPALVAEVAEGADVQFNAMRKATGAGEEPESWMNQTQRMVGSIATVYRKFATVSTNVGAIINAVNEALRSLSNLNLGTFVDLISSSVKFTGAVQNIAHAFGRGRGASPQRANTMVDMAHAGVRLWQEYGPGGSGYMEPEPTPVRPELEYLSGETRAGLAGSTLSSFMKERKFRQPLSPEQQTAFTELTSMLAQGESISVEQFSRLWKGKVSKKTEQELPELLAAVEQTYRKLAEVENARELLRQAAEESNAAADKASKSTVNALLSNENPNSQAAREMKDYLKTLPAKDLASIKAVEQMVMQLGGNTGLGSTIGAGVGILSPEGAKKWISSVHGAEMGRDSAQYAGLSSRLVSPKDNSASTFSFIQGGLDSPIGTADSLVHELVHSLTEANRGGQYQESFDLTRDFMAQGGRSDRFKRAVENEATQFEYPEFVEQTGVFKFNPEYSMKPEEIYSNIGASLLSTNQRLTDYFRKIYGDDLYDFVASELEANSPEVFSSENRADIRSRYEEFQANLAAQYEQMGGAGQGNRVDVGSNISRFVQDVKSGIEQFLSNLLNGAGMQVNQILDSIRTLFGSDVAAGLSSMIQSPQNATANAMRTNVNGLQIDLQKGLEAFTESYIENYGNTLLRMVKALNDNPQVKASLSRLAQGDLSQQNINELATSGGTTIARQYLGRFQGFQAGPGVGQSILAGRGFLPALQERFLSGAVENIGTRALADPAALLQRIQNTAMRTMPFSNKTYFEGAAGFLGRSLAPSSVDTEPIRQNLNEQLRSFGDAVKPESIDVKQYYDLEEGVMRVSASAVTARGEMVEFNGTVNEFGDVVANAKERSDGFFDVFKENLWRVPMELLEESVQNIVFAFMDLVGQIINVQDELAEVSTLLESAGGGRTLDPVDAAKQRANFLSDSIKAANDTGQQFQEGIQTNIQNFKQLAFVQDPEARTRIAADLSRLQLGTQTAFGLSLDESLNTIPAIYSQMQGQVQVPDDLAATMSDSEIQTWKAEKALTAMTEALNGLVVAQRESGASGKDLAQVYASLSASAKDAALDQSDLLSIAAVASVKLTGGADEITNAVKSIMERTYGEGANDLEKLGIQVRELKTDENGQQVLAPRAFTDILADAANLREQSPNLSKQITLAMGAQMRGPQALALIEGVGEQQRIAAATEAQDTGGTQFMDLVERKSQTFGGSLNKLQSSFALFLNQVMFGTSMMDDLGNIMERVADTFTMMANAITEHPEMVATIEAVAKSLLTGVVYGATKSVNALSLVARAFMQLSNSVKGAVTEFFQLGEVGAASLTPLQRAARVFVSTLDGMQVKSQSAFNPLITSVNGVTGELKEATAAADQLQAQLNETGKTGAATMNALQAGPNGTAGTFVGAAREFAAGYGGEKKGFWQSGIGLGLKSAGSFAGTMAAPVAFDAMMGGFNRENGVEIAAGLAGGIAGFFAGGPGGSIIGYSIAKGAADYLDIAGIGGTSQNEIDQTTKSFLEAYGLSTQTPGEKDRVDTVTERGVQAASVVSDRFNLQGVQDAYKNMNLGFNFGAPVSANNLKWYREQMAMPEDQRNLVFKGRQSYGAFNQVEQVSRMLDETAPPEFIKAIENANFSNMDELFALIEQMKDPTTEIGKQWAEAVTQMDAAREATEGVTVATAATGEAYITLDDKLAAISERLKQMKDESEFLYRTPKMLTTFGPMGSFQSDLLSSYNEKMGSVVGGGPMTDARRERFGQLTSEYDYARQSAAGIPDLLAVAEPLSNKLNQDYDQSAMVKQLYEAGPEVQAAFQSAIAPMVEMQTFVEEYQLMLEQIAAIQGSVEYAGGAGAEQQAAAQAELANLQQQTGVRSEMYQQYLAYLSMVKQSPQFLQQELAALTQQQQLRRQMSATVIPGTPAQFRMPSEVDVSDYSTGELAEALDRAREKQDDLVKMFPEAAKEFRKQQFLLSSDGQYKGVTGVSANFFQDALREIKDAAKAAPPETVDLREKSGDEIRQIVARARDLQGRAAALAPDAAKDFEDKRLLLLGKNNELLMESGVSQEYLRLAMEDNTKATEDTLRGHYNLPGSYRPPTIWDYYNEGGTEAGGNNYVMPGGNGDVPLEFATKLAEQMMANPGGIAGEGGPDLGSLGDTLQGAPLGYPEPGTPGKVILPPDLQLPDGITTNEIKVLGKIGSQGKFEDDKPPFAPDYEPFYPYAPGTGTGAIGVGTGAVVPPPVTPNDFLATETLLGGGVGTSSSKGSGAGADVERTADDFLSGVGQMTGGFDDSTAATTKQAKSSAAAASAVDIVSSRLADMVAPLVNAGNGGSIAAQGLGSVLTATSDFTKGMGGLGTALGGVVKQFQGVNFLNLFAQAINSGRIQIQINGQEVKVKTETGGTGAVGGLGGSSLSARPPSNSRNPL